jgi:hypothetical protein
LAQPCARAGAGGENEDAVAIVGISPSVPDDIRRKVAQEAARLREKEAVEKP